MRLDVAPNALERQPRARGRPGRRRRGRAWRRSARRRPGASRAAGAGWSELRKVEAEKRAAEQEELDDSRSPLHPVRVYRELGEVLDRDAIVVGDGGDFVSYAGRFIDTYEPGCWMDPGPFGCLGAGPGPGDRRQGRPSGPPGLPAARRRRLRLRRDGVRHDGAPRPRRGRGDGQQRDLGARASPDEVPLRLLGGGGAAAGDALRPAGRIARLRRHPRARARASCGRRWSGPSSRAGRPWSTSSPTPRSSTRASRIWLESRFRLRLPGRLGQNENRPPSLAADSSWPLRTGRGTSSGTMCIRWAQTAGGAMMRQSPKPCTRVRAADDPQLFPGAADYRAGYPLRLVGRKLATYKSGSASPTDFLGFGHGL